MPDETAPAKRLASHPIEGSASKAQEREQRRSRRRQAGARSWMAPPLAGSLARGQEGPYGIHQGWRAPLAERSASRRLCPGPRPVKGPPGRGAGRGDDLLAGELAKQVDRSGVPAPGRGTGSLCHPCQIPCQMAPSQRPPVRQIVPFCRRTAASGELLGECGKAGAKGTSCTTSPICF